MSNRSSWAVAALLAIGASAASAQAFSVGLPAGWECVGHCGTAAADGDVPLAPGGGSRYGFVTTASDVFGVSPWQLGPEFTGSRLRSAPFAGAAGATIALSFDYLTSDAGGYADYAWVRLLRAGDDSQAALLFTLRSTESGSIGAGEDMPLPEAALDPAVVEMHGPGPTWSRLGQQPGLCWGDLPGCGSTGWVGASYALAEGGSFRLEFGVVNWIDSSFQSGLAFDTITVSGVSVVSVVPEPQAWALMAGGLVLVAGAARRTRPRR